MEKDFKREIKYDLEGSYSMGTQDYMTLLKYVQNTDKIVELGSGQSTFQLAEDFPNSTLISLENDSKYANQNHDILKSIHKKSSRVIYTPVKLLHKNGMKFMTYDFKLLKDVNNINVLIIDGPVERIYPMGREASLYFLFDKLAIGAKIALDDYHRYLAKKAVSNWLYIFGDNLKIKEETSSFVILEKISECNKPRFSFLITINSYANTFKSLYRIYRRLFGGFRRKVLN